MHFHKFFLKRFLYLSLHFHNLLPLPSYPPPPHFPPLKTLLPQRTILPPTMTPLSFPSSTIGKHSRNGVAVMMKVKQ